MAIVRWTAAAGIVDGALLRPVTRNGHVTPSRISSQAIFGIVKFYAEMLGVEVGPHDLRRSFTRLAHLGEARTDDSAPLGHASVVTTELYLGVQQNLHDAPCDHLGLMLQAQGEPSAGVLKSAVPLTDLQSEATEDS